ncbi:MAG: radical SAM/SPASM domain-containing protein [bacterium]
MNNGNHTKGYLRLHPRAALKHLESSYVYHAARDELYEIDVKAETFLSRCDGTLSIEECSSDSEFVEYCLEEELLEILDQPDRRAVSIDYAPNPSLRYLELQLLHACNLKCRHCYLGPARPDVLSLDDALTIAREFALRGGLRLLISGGEPMLYPYLKDFLAETAKLNVYRVLLTNGTLINEDTMYDCAVENIQFSLDGWQEGHDLLRGPGSFEKTIRGIYTARHAGIPVSIATMIHRGNINDFERIKRFTEQIDATEWGVDVLCMAGSLTNNRDLLVPYDKAAPFMNYAYGGGNHSSSSGFACGRHLMTVLPTGMAVKCGFFENSPLGDASSGLIRCWMNLKHIALDELECKDCSVIDTCAGGCRFRAPHTCAPDPAMCAYYGKTCP